MSTITPEERAADTLEVRSVVTLTLWQVSVVDHGGKQYTFYLDAQVQGIRTEREALQWVADNLRSHRRVSVMAITYQVVPPTGTFSAEEENAGADDPYGYGDES